MKYKVEEILWSKFEQELNERAKSGWEFDTIIRGPGPGGMHYIILFKHK